MTSVKSLRSSGTKFRAHASNLLLCHDEVSESELPNVPKMICKFQNWKLALAFSMIQFFSFLCMAFVQ